MEPPSGEFSELLGDYDPAGHLHSLGKGLDDGLNGLLDPFGGRKDKQCATYQE